MPTENPNFFMDVPLSASETHPSHQSQQSSSGAAGGPQIRSRVTVVCAECKRLKLKCDRRTPCGSCTKRDTVARCVYSAAAAEKVDLHSLNNRLSLVESQIAQFTTPGARPHPYHPKASYSPAHVDRTVLVVGKSGSSLSISLDDITSIWLDELDLGKDVLPVQELQSQSSCPAYASPSQVKQESLTVALPGQEPTSGLELPIPLLLPPISAYFSSPSPAPHDAPCVTARLMAHLPFAPRKRQRLYDNVEDVLKMHPCFNFKHFKDRAESMFRWASEINNSLDGGSLDGPSPGHRSSNSSNFDMPAAQKAELARSIFFSNRATTPFSSAKGLSPVKPTVSFFAAVAAAFALGTLIDREVTNEEARIIAAAQSEGTSLDNSSPSCSRPVSRRRAEAPPLQGKKSKGIQKDAVSTPSVLLALSQQALSLFEKSNPYDLDYLVTMILHVLYALHDSKTRVAHNLLPDVGKMVNIARIMGLDTDPDEFMGTFNLFEAESRRRLWWDIFYYDLFVSDYMGRSPLISDMEHTTRLPMDVDEDVFTPACTSLPLPRSPMSLVEPNISDFKYFRLKCRLAQLIKDIKKRSFRDSLRDDSEAQEQYSLEQAMSCANDIKQWLAELPAAFRLDIDPDVSNGASPQQNAAASSPTNDSPAVSPVLLAQRCELIVTAQRLIMKVYIPFLRPSNGHANPTTHYQASVGIFTAAHTIIRAVRMLCSMWKQRPDLKGKRPTPALFSLYSFGRTLFDAAVACAHNVIKDPTSVWVRTAIEDVNYALEVMRDPMLNTSRGPMRGGVEGDVHEAIRIVALLQKKADMARRGNLDGLAPGSKRKRDEGESDTERLPNSFQLPFLPATVSSANVELSVPVTPGAGVIVAPKSTPIPKEQDVSPPEEPQKPTTPSAPPCSKRQQTGQRDPKCKDKHAKKPPYPQTGIRVRPGKDAPPFSRVRSTSSLSCTPEPNAGNDSMVPLSQTSAILSTPNSECPPYPSQRSLAYPSEKPSSPEVQRIHHQSMTEEPPDERNTEIQAPFVTNEQSRPQLGQLSQPQQYMHTEGTESPQFVDISPSASSYEQNRSMSNDATPISYSQPSMNFPDVSSSYSTNGPSPHSAPQMSRAPSAHHQQSPPFAGDLQGPQQSYFSLNPRYESNMNDTSLATMGINPSMTFHTSNEQFSMEDVSHSGLFHHRQEKPHQSVYMTKPTDHHHTSMPQQPFSVTHSHTVSQQPWPQESTVQDNGFWRTPYDHFMPS